MEALAPPDIEALLDLFVILSRVAVEEPERLLVVLMEQVHRLVRCDAVVLTLCPVPLGESTRTPGRRGPADALRPRAARPPVHELHLDVPASRDRALRIACYRRSERFGGREETVLVLLADPLQRLLERVRPAPARHEAEALTPRERQVLLLAAEGRTNKEIGRDLFLAPDTVRKHLEHVYGKLGVHNRTEASALLRAGGLRGGATRT